jgi:hypothetical protein
MNQEILNKFKSPKNVTVIKVRTLARIWTRFKNEWWKDREEVTGRQTGKGERKKGLV